MTTFIRRAILTLTFAATFPLAAQEGVFGGIELASSSVKGLTFTFQPGADSTEPGASRMKRLQYAERNGNYISMRDGCKLSDKGMTLLVKQANEVIKELRDGAKAKSLDNMQLYGVGSSGLGAVCNQQEVLARVQAETGLCMEFITASDEARYSLGFVLPRDRYRSLILDIGSGNTKAGYYVVTKGANWPPKEWHGFEIPYGARTLKDKALARMKQPPTDVSAKPLDFYQAVDQVLLNDLLPEINQLKADNSAWENFSRVYMVGGVVWATSTRMRPIQQEEWAINSLSPANFDSVLAKIKDGTFGEYSTTDFAGNMGSKTRENAENELSDVLQRFDLQSLYAGVSLARFIIRETTPTARIYFPTTAAWISGYARQKFVETGHSAPACAATPLEHKSSY